MELDTVAVVSLITEQTYKQKFSHVPMTASTQKLHKCLGDSLTVDIGHEGVLPELLLMVVHVETYIPSIKELVAQKQTQVEQNLRPTSLGEQIFREGHVKPRILASKVPANFLPTDWEQTPA